MADARVDIVEISDEEFDALCSTGQVLAVDSSCLTVSLVNEIGPPRELLIPIIIEIAAVVIGIVAGEIASVIASKKFKMALSPGADPLEKLLQWTPFNRPSQVVACEF